MSAAEEVGVRERVPLVLNGAWVRPQVLTQALDRPLGQFLLVCAVAGDRAGIQVVPALDTRGRIARHAVDGVPPLVHGGLRDLLLRSLPHGCYELVDMQLSGAVLVNGVENGGDLHVAQVGHYADQDLADFWAVQLPIPRDVHLREQVADISTLRGARLRDLLDDCPPPHRALVEGIVLSFRERAVVTLHVLPAEKLVLCLPLALLRRIGVPRLLLHFSHHLGVPSAPQLGILQRSDNGAGVPRFVARPLPPRCLRPWRLRRLPINRRLRPRGQRRSLLRRWSA
mmetsp:Transcript_72706/g.210488  ORF Transcript_72706/g.210488 Transcript_72706/m.210488 type:complete len:284 (-) Transcript_72706:319-1170(-)